MPRKKRVFGAFQDDNTHDDYNRNHNKRMRRSHRADEEKQEMDVDDCNKENVDPNSTKADRIFKGSHWK